MPSKEVCVGVYFPFPNSFCYSSPRFPFQKHITEKVGAQQKAFTHITAAESFFRKNKVDVTLDPLPKAPNDKVSTFIPLWHTINSPATAEKPYHAGFFFHACKTGSVPSNIWQEFPAFCANAPMREPLAGSAGAKGASAANPKRSVSEADAEYDEEFESIVQSVMKRSADMIENQPEKVICHFMNLADDAWKFQQSELDNAPSGNATEILA
eukprot:TRINITY_DN12314_c0_g1_i1.p1 TRINITY_DN12314_c0_g1~~TRINITY_DN12314_c0_g1_i1.p1  ORF type:complete len:211 (+),score=52.91 TRINITY_DN12314_c0_g1_i1:658-1290(+)